MDFKWDMIRSLGGEPTVHPDVMEIMRLLCEYRAQHNSECTMLFVSNGYGDKVKKVLSHSPKEVIIDNAAKKGIVHWFTASNWSPIDLKRYFLADYSVGCGTLCENGIGLNLYGHYPCAPAGGIDRVMGFDVGRKTLPAADDQMFELRKTFRRYCRHFFGLSTSREAPLVSVTREKAFDKYNMEKKQLSSY